VIRTTIANPANVISNKLGSEAGASKIKATVSAAAPRYPMAASAFSSSFFVKE